MQLPLFEMFSFPVVVGRDAMRRYLINYIVVGWDGTQIDVGLNVPGHEFCRSWGSYAKSK